MMLRTFAEHRPHGLPFQPLNEDVVARYTLPPGAPIPDLVQLAFFPEEGQEIVTIMITWLAQGVLHEASGYPEGTFGVAGLIRSSRYAWCSVASFAESR